MKAKVNQKLSPASPFPPCCRSSVRVWQCVQCGGMTGGGIKSQKKNSGIAGECRFCGKNVAARLRWWNSDEGFHDRGAGGHAWKDGALVKLPNEGVCWRLQFCQCGDSREKHGSRRSYDNVIGMARRGRA